MACAGCNQERVMIAMKIMQRRVCDKDMQAARVILARTRFDTRGIESLDLKISKVMPKCGSKTLNISTGGGNIPMMMVNICIICIQRDRQHTNDGDE